VEVAVFDLRPKRAMKRAIKRRDLPVTRRQKSEPDASISTSASYLTIRMALPQVDVADGHA
jgi:hypothetical protein